MLRSYGQNVGPVTKDMDGLEDLTYNIQTT